MDPLTTFALTVSACSFVADGLLLYRQTHIAPWDHNSSDAELEHLIEESEKVPQDIESQLPIQDTHDDDSAPLLNPQSPKPTTYGGTNPNKNTPSDSDAIVHHPTNAVPTPPSTTTASPQPAPYTKWYHFFMPWYLFHLEPKLHPQHLLSQSLFVFTVGSKVGLADLYWMHALAREDPTAEPSPFLHNMLIAYGWFVVAWILCQGGVYWRSHGWGKLSGAWMGRARVLVWAIAEVVLWMSVYYKRGLDLRDWAMEMPFAMLVGMSFGVAWERWV